MLMPEHSRDHPDALAGAHDRWARLAQRALSADGALVALWEEGAARVSGASGLLAREAPAASLLAPASPLTRLSALHCGLTLREVALTADGRAGSLAAVALAAEGGAARGVMVVAGEAGRRWTEAEMDALRDAAAAAAAAVDLQAERAARGRLEGALQRSEASFRAIFDNTALGIALVGTDGWLIRTNPALQRMLGLDEEELRGRLVAEFVHPDDRVAVEETLGSLAAGQVEFDRVECRLAPPGRPLLWTSVITSLVRDRQRRPLCGIALVEDITQRKAAEEALRESQRQLMLSQRMEAVGRLAGGVAHDFNNLLTAIGSFAQLLALELQPRGDGALYLDEIQKASSRAASLTRQLLAFSRQQVLRPQRLDLNRVVRELQEMLRRLIGENVALHTELDADLWGVRADPGQVEQVLVNLVVNARDAMPQGGQVRVQTRNATLSEADAGSYPYPVAAGEYVRVTVSDTGAGMDPETLPHIFEPFYTTKGLGQGTGLGLATVYGVVKQSGGYIWVESTPGAGTTFDIYLPALPAGDAETPEARTAPPVRGGTETILLVEDEEVIRGLAERVLAGHGYTVLAAEHGEAALRLHERHAGAVHLLLTDVVMPGINGRALAEQLRRRDPSLTIAFMSGYTADAIQQYGVFDPGTAFLDKPFTPDELARAVREALDGKREK